MGIRNMLNNVNLVLKQGWQLGGTSDPSLTLSSVVFTMALWHLMAVNSDSCHQRKCAVSPRPPASQGRGLGVLSGSV